MSVTDGHSMNVRLHVGSTCWTLNLLGETFLLFYYSMINISIILVVVNYIFNSFKSEPEYGFK